MTLRCRRHPRHHASSLRHSEPTRRGELPLDGLRDRYTTVVRRGQSSDANRLLLEPAIGVEPTCPCVAHRAVTWTHRLGGAAWQHLVSRITVGATAAFGDSSRGTGRIRTDVLSG